jgi:hypothetical protein
VVLGLVVRDGGQLAGGQPQHRAALQVLPDDDVVAPRQHIDRRLVTMHDDIDRLRSRRQMVGKVRAQPRTRAGCGRRNGHTHGQQRAHDQIAKHSDYRHG